MGVPIPMRATMTLGLLGTLLAGCMAPMEAEDLVLEDGEAAAFDELRHIPDAPRLDPPTPVVDEDVETPAPPPAPAGAKVRPRFVADTSEESCTSVYAEGFPAISVDGSTVVVPRADHLQLSMISGSLELQWHDAYTGEIVESDGVIDGLATEDGTCPAMERADRKSLREANRALAARRWRSMESLPVAFTHPDVGGKEYRDEYFADVSASDRVPQLGIRHGQIFLRIPGVRVLERTPASPQLHSYPIAAFGDRATGTVVIVSMDCVGESCTCDPSFTAQVVQWQPEALETIAQRPCLDPEKHDEVADGWANCEPMDFGFGPALSAWSIG